VYAERFLINIYSLAECHFKKHVSTEIYFDKIYVYIVSIFYIHNLIVHTSGVHRWIHGWIWHMFSKRIFNEPFSLDPPLGIHP